MMKRLKVKSSEDYQVMPKMLRSSSKKLHQKTSDRNNSTLDDTSSLPPPPPPLPPPILPQRVSSEDAMKINVPSASMYSIKDLSPDQNSHKVEEHDESRKNLQSFSPKDSDSEVTWKQIKVKREEVYSGMARKKHPKLSYLETSKEEWQRPEIVHLEPNFNDETNCNNNGSNRSSVVIKQEYDLIPPIQSVPIKKCHSNSSFSYSDIYPANSPVLESTISEIPSRLYPNADHSKPTSEKSSTYQQNNNALHTSWTSDGKLQETNSKKLESLSIQTQEEPSQHPSQTSAASQETTMSTNPNLDVPNYMHEDSCLSLLLSEDHEQNVNHHVEPMGETLSELVPTSHPARNSLLPIPTHPSPSYNYFAPTQHLGPKQDYLNLGPPKTSHDLQPWMTMGLQTPQPPNVSSPYLCPGPQMPFGSSLAPYPQQPMPHTSAMCWNQNLPVYEGGMMPGPMAPFSDGGLMPGHLMKNQSQGCYFVHSMIPSPSAPFSFLPNQNPSQMRPTLQNMPIKGPSKATMIRMPMIRLPEILSTGQNFISTGKSAFNKSPSAEWHDFQSDNNPDSSQDSQILNKNAKLVDHNRTDELFGIFQDFQIPKSMNGAAKGQFILRKYIDFLILENEGITEMSQAYTPSTPLFSLEEDQYILEAASNNTSFPTSKFERFIQIHFPSIDLPRIDFWECKGTVYMPRKLDTDVDKIRDIFFYFQTLRGTKSNVIDTAGSESESLVI